MLKAFAAAITGLTIYHMLTKQKSVGALPTPKQIEREYYKLSNPKVLTEGLFPFDTSKSSFHPEMVLKRGMTHYEICKSKKHEKN